ncbi:hypothetical protein FE633_46485, partial [Streptomyces montanus]
MHGNDISTTRTARTGSRGRRPRLRKTLALLTGALLAGASLGLATPQAGAAVADPGGAPAAPAAPSAAAA